MLGTIQIPYIQQFLYVITNHLFNEMKNRKAPSWKKNEDRMFWIVCIWILYVLDYIKNSKIPNLQLFHLFMEETK